MPRHFASQHEPHDHAHEHVHPQTAAPAQALRAAGQRVTGVRVAVIETLASQSRAMDAAELLALLNHRHPSGASFDRVSVYRTLSMLVEAGIAHRIDAGDRVFRYSLTDHSRCSEAAGHRHDHPHMVCEACGGVECLTDAQVVVTHPRSRTSARGTPKFKVRVQEVTLRGVCDRCHEQGGATTAPPTRTPTPTPAPPSGLRRAPKAASKARRRGRSPRGAG